MRPGHARARALCARSTTRLPESPLHARPHTHHRWASVPPELLRKVVVHLRAASHPPQQAGAALQALRRTCASWRGVLDADVTHLAPTAPLDNPAAMFSHFPGCTSLDLSRFQAPTVTLYPHLHRLQLR